MAAVENLVELVYRTMARKAYRSEDRMAVVLLEQVSMIPAYLQLYHAAQAPGQPENFVEISITLNDVNYNWNISRTAITNTLKGPLTDEGIIRSYGRQKSTIVDLYCLRRFVEERKIITPYV